MNGGSSICGQGLNHRNKLFGGATVHSFLKHSFLVYSSCAGKLCRWGENKFELLKRCVPTHSDRPINGPSRYLKPLCVCVMHYIFGLHENHRSKVKYSRKFSFSFFFLHQPARGKIYLVWPYCSVPQP